MTGAHGMMQGYGNMVWGMGLVSILVLALLVLGAAAPVKYLSKEARFHTVKCIPAVPRLRWHKTSD